MNYNDPFYFAIPRGDGPSAMQQAIAHVGATFGVFGMTEIVRSELAFTLCRITGGSR